MFQVFSDYASAVDASTVQRAPIAVMSVGNVSRELPLNRRMMGGSTYFPNSRPFSIPHLWYPAAELWFSLYGAHLPFED